MRKGKTNVTFVLDQGKDNGPSLLSMNSKGRKKKEARSRAEIDNPPGDRECIFITKA